MTNVMIGFAIGITLTTVMWSMMLIKGAKKRVENERVIQELLFRKADSIERIAQVLEERMK